MFLAGYSLVSAHANLVRSEPAANTILAEPPPEIRLWFTEPLEAQFSKINLRDQNGNIINTPPSTVDPTDAFQMSLAVPGNLPDGIYTVVWRTLSQADGHPSLGSFAIGIGAVEGGFSGSERSSAAIPIDSALIRWSNLVSLALGVGGIGFLIFVWSPAISAGRPMIERRIKLLIWVGWIFIGITGFFLLLMQYALATGYPILIEINGDSLNSLVADTRFGHLWLARMALWAGLGGALWFANNDSWFNWVALMIGAAILAINSVFSHANAAFDLTASVAADWLHLLGMALWVGGLLHFINVIGAVRQEFQPNSTGPLGRLVGHFSNFARVSVAVLIVTGLYSTWLQVGSVEGLLTTPYGQALLIKLILMIPVMVIAFINLVYTHRGLEAGREIWGGRLRALVGTEIALTLGILMVVGIMTSIQPARNTLAERAANPPPPAAQPIKAVQTAEGMVAQLDISPGWVGENTFALKLADNNGEPINDATLVRMRFESQEQNIGESELRPILAAEGVYTATGANLSVTGEWRIRITIQRLNQFDTLIDFRPNVPAPPPPPEIIPPPQPGQPLPNRILALLAAGVSALAVGGFFLGENRANLLRASSLLAIGLLIVGGILLASAVQGVNTVNAANTPYQPEDSAPVRMAVNSNLPLPYIITAGGQLLEPDDSGVWRPLGLEASVRDVYVDMRKVIWAATDEGFYAYQDNAWRQISDQPASRVILTHGFMFALGKGNITRVPLSELEDSLVRELDIPLIDQPADDFVMLGNHSHILENGSQLYHSFDLGLSWQAVPAPDLVDAVGIDVDGNLIAATENALVTWSYASSSWGKALPLPGGDSRLVMRTFNERLYALGSGKLYRLESNQWETIELPDSDDAHLTAMEFQYPGTLWVLDSAGARLWSSGDGEKWNPTFLKT
jgi:copper transport protein